MTLKITSTQVVQTSVADNNSPSQDFANLDDQPTTSTFHEYLELGEEGSSGSPKFT